MGLEGVKSGAFVLRFFELITSIVAFATIAEWDWASSKIRFTMFTGITGMILALFFMLMYIVGVKAARGMVALVLDAVWCIFWLSAAACMSDIVAAGGASSDFKASCAFSWISFFLWVGSAIISFLDTRGGQVQGPPPGAPTIPNSSVSMV